MRTTYTYGPATETITKRGEGAIARIEPDHGFRVALLLNVLHGIKDDTLVYLFENDDLRAILVEAIRERYLDLRQHYEEGEHVLIDRALDNLNSLTP